MQDMLLDNGNKEAVFDVSKLTAFEVTVLPLVASLRRRSAPKMSVLWLGEKCVGICKSSRFVFSYNHT